MLSTRTLTFLCNAEDILLIQRPPDARLFPGMFNGVGGHVERGEDIMSAAQREVCEETGLDVPDLTLSCIIHVDEGADRHGVLVFVFVGHTKQRDVVESCEGTLHWVPLAQIDELNLIPDLPSILKRVLQLPVNAQPLFARSVISPAEGIWEIAFNP
jgi:8-oxo-dGTP diphosphatase